MCIDDYQWKEENIVQGKEGEKTKMTTRLLRRAFALCAQGHLT